jgi:hypothetical protein
VAAHADERFKHEREEMETTDDLREVDDDVEAEATLLEWRAHEHHHTQKSPTWRKTLFIGTGVVIAILLFLSNFMAAITIALAAWLVYYVAHREPEIVRYRIMVDGVALNNYLYHFRDLDGFNIVYEPNDTKVVLLRSKKRLVPIVAMEIGDADPIAIRNLLLEFLPEDQDMQEPLPDFWGRQLGF